jgi:hypothetical protein
MQLNNLGIDLDYNPSVLVSYSGRLVRHGICIDQGDRIVWAWFLQDSVHNYACTPHPDYAQYNPPDKLVKYNQVDFAFFGAL